MGYLHYFELLKLAPKYNSRSDRQDSKDRAYLLMFPSPEFSSIKDSLFRYRKTLVPSDVPNSASYVISGV